MLRTRLISAAILAPIVLVVVLVGEPWISLLVGLVSILALIELAALLEAGGFEPPRRLVVGAGLVVVASVLLAANRAALDGSPPGDLLRAADPPGLPLLALVAAIVALAVAGFARDDPRSGFLTWATASFGLGYVALLTPFVVVVAHLAPPDGSASTAVGTLSLRSGSAWALMLIAIVWGYDTGAYAVGRLAGRRRLIPHISPAKTVEGLAGGVALAILAAGLGAWLVGLELWHALLIGPLVGLAAQAGDLAESLLKRAAGRKESGVLIPGHGGMLDRIDSFLFAAPALAGYALLAAGRVL